jgi:AraC family transcriptional regulator, transcriptional activator of pobA
MRKIQIPDYFVYGETARSLDVGFVHVELISARKNLHRGQVEAHQHALMAQITFWTEGGGTYEIEDQSWIFSAPAISFVPSGVVHGFSVSEQSDAIVVSIANDAFEDIKTRHDAPNPNATFLQKNASNAEWQDIESMMQLLLREYQRQRPHMQNSITHLAGVVIDFIARNAAHLDRAEVKHSHPLAERLRHLIDQNFRQKRTVEQYAIDLHTTYHILDKAARLGFSKPVKQLILERRLLEAKRLLKFTIRSAENIAFELGFDDPAYFNRQFKQSTGSAPGQWRALKDSH